MPAVKPEDSSNQIIAGCASDGANRFVVKGKGGISDSPFSPVIGNLLWQDNRNSSTSQQSQSQINSTVSSSPKQQIAQIIPAQNWIINNDGTVTLIADSNKQNNLDITANCN